MAIEILLLTEGILKIAPALLEALGLLNRRVRGSELKKIKTDIEDALRDVYNLGEIGEVLKNYNTYQFESYLMYTTSVKLIETVNYYHAVLSDENSQIWQVVERQFSDIKEAGRSIHTDVKLFRLDYLDKKDDEQVNSYDKTFNETYQKAKAYLKEKNAEEFKSCIDDLSDQAFTLYKIFEKSINDMANKLIHIKRGKNESIRN
jgi:hypothetical protein